MKLLVVASSIYDRELFAKRKSITGLEIMVRDILDGVSDQIECSVFTTSLKTNGKSLGNAILLPNKTGAFISAIKNSGWKKLCEIYQNNPINNVRERLKLSMSTFIMEDYINSLKPDLINIHDLNDWNTFFVQRLIKKNHNVLLTDHLYIGTKEHSYGYNSLRKNEEAVFNLNGDFSVSFVSTGMRSRFLSDYSNFPRERAYSVVNGTNIATRQTEINQKPTIFEKTKGKKVLLCIGGYNARKNQLAIENAFREMDDTLKKKVCVFFIGVGKKLKLKKEIYQSELSDSLFYISHVSPAEISSYYHFCDGTITTSLNESFGLTIIEGFSYGKPAILFNDIDSFSDLYDEGVCEPIKEHTTTGVISAISKMIERNWDSEYIKSYVDKFSLERVQRDYLNMYCAIVGL